MKQLIKALLALVMATLMSFAMISVAAAEHVRFEENSEEISVALDDDDSKAYTLVWRFKTEGGHLYKRRWNKTLGTWYDPAWILVN